MLCPIHNTHYGKGFGGRGRRRCYECERTTMSNPWICPKCGRVWGPMVPHCGPCNSEIATREEAKAPIIQPQHRPRTAHEDYPATMR